MSTDDVRTFCRSQRLHAQLNGHRPRGDWYGSHDLIGELGTGYTGQVLPERYAIGEPQFCFANAYRLARRHHELRYVEGVATRVGVIPIPLDHAWCIDPDGQVIDPTWHGRDGETVGADYLGLEFPLEQVANARVRNKGDWSVFGSDYRGRHWLLGGGWRELWPDAVVPA